MLARVCDNCGKQIGKNEKVIRIFMGEVEYLTGKLDGKMTPVNEKDLCEECASKAIASLREGEVFPSKGEEKKTGIGKGKRLEQGQRSV